MTSFSVANAIPERTSAQYACTFQTPSGNTIIGSAITSITCGLYDHTGTAINARNGNSSSTVLNSNGGTVANTGAFTLLLTALDTVAVGQAELQPRSLVLNVEYSSGTLTHEVSFFVRNRAKITN